MIGDNSKGHADVVLAQKPEGTSSASGHAPFTPGGIVSRRTEWIVGSLIIALAAALRFYGLGFQPLWLDEAYSWWDAHQSLSSLWNLVPQCDPHPPLYFVILKGWMFIFGDGESAMRALSALIGVATTIAVMFAGREIDRRAGWLAGILFALTPFQIEFSHEARPYALLCFGASLIVYGALRVVRAARDGSGAVVIPAATPFARIREGMGLTADSGLAGWIALFAGGLTVMWSNDTSILILGALCIVFAVLARLDPRSRPLFKPFAIVIIFVFLCWLPYLPTMLEQARGVSSDFWIQKPIGWRITNELRFVLSLSEYDAVWWAVAAMVGGMILMARKGAWRQAALLGSLMVLPALFNWGISMEIKPIFIARALIGIVPAAAVLLAVSVVMVRNVAMRRIAIGVLLTAHCLALYSWVLNYQGKEPWNRIASQVVAARTLSPSSAGANDAIVLVAANELALPLSHALEDMHMSIALQGAPANFPSPGMNARYPSGKCAPSVVGQDLTSIARAVKGRRIVYFITRHNNVYDPGDGIVKFLTAQGWIQSSMTTYMPGYLEVHQFVAPVHTSAVAHLIGGAAHITH